jgi:hypothetical protein
MAGRHGLYPLIIVRLLPASAVLGKALGEEEHCQLFLTPGLPTVSLFFAKGYIWKVLSIPTSPSSQNCKTGAAYYSKSQQKSGGFDKDKQNLLTTI